MIQCDEHIFFNWVVQPPARKVHFPKLIWTLKMDMLGEAIPSTNHHFFCIFRFQIRFEGCCQNAWRVELNPLFEGKCVENLLFARCMVLTFLDVHALSHDFL